MHCQDVPAACVDAVLTFHTHLKAACMLLQACQPDDMED